MIVSEGNNVTLKCAAVGQPEPTIIWRRERGKPLLSVAGSSKESTCLWPATVICQFGFGIHFESSRNGRTLQFLNYCFPFSILSVFTAEGTTLSIPRVNRHHMGAYLCIASNGVPPTVSKRVMLIVNCKWEDFKFYNKNALEVGAWLFQEP